ncbi:MAG TPA: hypothetical protein VF696_00645 [Candidatus Paceibacterota bacterium]|jgi:hypothetical protein
MSAKTYSVALAVILVLAMFALVSSAFAATTYLGGASTNNGELTLTSQTGDTNADNDYGVAVFEVATSTTFADLNSLSVDYNVTDDSCMGGSPRFQIRVDTGSGIKNIFSYLGATPNYTGCPLNTWVDSGDLLSSGRTLDTSQLPGGTFYDSYEHALSAYGSYPVVSVQLVVDAGWASGDAEQTVIFDNVEIDGTTHDFTPSPPPPAEPTNKDQCKNGGWKTFTNPSFKNQGQCVSHAQHERNANR